MAAIDGEAGTAITGGTAIATRSTGCSYDVTVAAVSPPPRRRRDHRRRRRPRHPLGALGRQHVGHRHRDQQALLDVLHDRYRDFAGIADHPGVTLVHDEARSYLTRTTERFDVLQMSLIDTWAATGAGAFTLTENGLYTREAGGVPRRADADGRVQRVALVRSRRTCRRRPACCRSAWRRCSIAACTTPRHHLDAVDARARRDAAGLAVAVHRRGSATSCDAHRRARGFDAARSRRGRPAAAIGSSASRDARPRRARRRRLRDPLLRLLAADRRAAVLLQHAQAARRSPSDTPRRAAASSAATSARRARSLALCVIAAVLVAGDHRSGRSSTPAGPRCARARSRRRSRTSRSSASASCSCRSRSCSGSRCFLGHPTYTFSIILFLDDPVRRRSAASLSERMTWPAPARALAAARDRCGSCASRPLLLQPVVGGTVRLGARRPHAGRARVRWPAVVRSSGCCFRIGMRLVGRLSPRRPRGCGV